MAEFRPLPARSGCIAYRHRAGGGLWGEETWRQTRDRAGNRCLTVHCEMTFADEEVVRDSLLAVDARFQPLEAYVRILNHGVPTGSGWFRFAGAEAEGESFSNEFGRLSERVAIERPLRGFGIHALMGDGWLTAPYPLDKGPGSEHFFGRNLIHSLHHFGATGPRLETTTSGLRYAGIEQVSVPAGRFACHRFEMIGMSNQHPPYAMWITADGDFLYVRGEVEGYMDAVFELEELNG